MSLDCTKTLKNRIWVIPDVELGVDNGREFVERAEEAIVEPEATQELPDPFNGVEFGAVRGKKEQDEPRFLFEPPRAVEVGVVVFGVVDDDDDTATGAAGDAPKPAEIVPAGLGVEVAFRLGSAELPVTEADSTEVTYRLAGRSVMADRIRYFRGNPHLAAAAVLLEMNLIHRPKIDRKSTRLNSSHS